MTQEDKELLLKDLCARLPYRAMIEVYGESQSVTESLHNITDEGNVEISYTTVNIETIKPYLRPMSSMTEEENKEFFSIWTGSIRGDMIAKIDFYIKHHFDFRLTSEGLSMIEAGLALEAPKDMYKIK